MEILVQGALDRFGRIDALVNIAGAVPQTDLFEMTDAQWEDGLALKLHGARRLTIRAWNALKASKGSVVLISGSAALDPKPAPGPNWLPKWFAPSFKFQGGFHSWVGRPCAHDAVVSWSDRRCKLGRRRVRS